MNTLTDTTTLTTEQLADIADAIGYTLEELQDNLTVEHNADFDLYDVNYMFYVFTDYDRAEAYARQSLADSLDDYFCEVPEWAMTFVDTDKFINEVIQHDGCGFVLAGYDHEELETQGGLFVYRYN